MPQIAIIGIIGFLGNVGHKKIAVAKNARAILSEPRLNGFLR